MTAHAWNHELRNHILIESQWNLNHKHPLLLPVLLQY